MIRSIDYVAHRQGMAIAMPTPAWQPTGTARPAARRLGGHRDHGHGASLRQSLSRGHPTKVEPSR